MLDGATHRAVSVGATACSGAAGPGEPGQAPVDAGRPGSGPPRRRSGSWTGSWTGAWLACLAACVVVVLAVCAIPFGTTGTGATTAGTARSGATVVERPVAGGVTAGSSSAMIGEVREVLDRRAVALLRHDRAGWLSVLPPGDDRMRAEQGALFDSLVALPITRWEYEVLTATAPAPGTGAVRVDLWLRYRLAGDTLDVARRRVVTFVPALGARVRSPGGAGRWALTTGSAARAGIAQPAAATGGAGERDPWELGAVDTVRGRRSVVIGPAGTAASLAPLVALTDASAARVDAVWGTGWRREVVVVLPRDIDEFAQLLGQDRAAIGQLAAVTTGPVARAPAAASVTTAAGTGVGAADRVVLNPAAWSELTGVGRQVVLTHELMHVATRGTTPATPPTWLEEGLAEYVAFRGTGVPATTIVADVRADVRAGRLPARLPPAVAFDPEHGDIAPAYAQAWAACDRIEALAGVPGLVAVYRDAAGGNAGSRGEDADTRFATALRERVRLSPRAFVVLWQERLRTLAGSHR